MALGDGTAWDETTPSNATNVSDGDDHIRDLRLGTRIRLAKEHVTPAASSVGGEHTFVTLQQQATKPTLSGSQTGAVYIKDVSGTDEMFYENSAGTELQLTSAGALNVSIAAAYPIGYLYGGVITNNSSDATNDLDISACYCRASDDSVNISVAALTKRVDATFVAGTGNGGLDTGSIGATADIIYIYAISDGSSTTDILFSKDSSAPTMPSGYTKKRLIGTRYWTGSAWAAIRTLDKGLERFVWFIDPPTVLSSGSATSFTDVDLSSYIAAGNVSEVRLSSYGSNTSFYVRANGSAQEKNYGARVDSSTSTVSGHFVVPLDSSGIFEYAVDTSQAITFVLRGYKEVL